MDDILDGPARVRTQYPDVVLRRGLKVEHRGSRFGGVVAGLEDGRVVILGRSGQERVFALAPGAFTVDGKAVTLVRPKPKATAPGVTASGSVAVQGAKARVARGSRILVEGVHDAELVEKVWGDDLRVEGVVVERLDGADNLAEVVRAFDPRADRRLGILLDHLVDGTKEARLAEPVRRHPHVLVTGHPYVDVWQAVKPAAAGIAAWPDVPLGEPWKEGVCRRLGVDPATFWRQLLGRVRSYVDLEPPLVGAVERLIDFVTDGDPG